MFSTRLLTNLYGRTQAHFRAPLGSLGLYHDLKPKPWSLFCRESRPTLCHPLNRSTPGFPVLHHLPEFKPRQRIKIRDVSLLTKVCVVKAMACPVVTYGCESWTGRKCSPVTLYPASTGINQSDLKDSENPLPLPLRHSTF